MTTWTEAKIVRAVADRWYPMIAGWAICNRVSHSMLNWEADLIAINKNGMCDEVEAKCSKADLRADLGKVKWKYIEKGLWSHFADRFWYAVPPFLCALAVEQAKPRGFGVVVVDRIQHDREDPYYTTHAVRVLKPKRLHKDSTERRAKMMEKRPELWRLCGFRYWTEGRK